jgi:hypothetical protein
MADSATVSSARLSENLKTAAKYIYWILGLAIVVGIAYTLYNRFERPIAGVLFFMAGIMALYYYWVKWFLAPAARDAVWPPYQTPCPDYLTMMTGAAANGTYKCMDFVGVSRNDRIKRADPKQINSQINSNEYTFLVDPKENRETLRQRVNATGLTWSTLFGEM